MGERPSVLAGLVERLAALDVRLGRLTDQVRALDDRVVELEREAHERRTWALEQNERAE